MENIFKNNYVMAIISIALIVIIVVVSLNVRISEQDNAGQAYNIGNDVIRVEKSAAMTRTYIATEPVAYAYMRDDP